MESSLDNPVTARKLHADRVQKHTTSSRIRCGLWEIRAAEPDLPVSIVRAEKSGTTDGFTRYLSQVSESFKTQVGRVAVAQVAELGHRGRRQ